MRLKTLVLATSLLWPVSVSSQQARFFATGNDLFRFCSAGGATSESLCNGYVAGVVRRTRAAGSGGSVPELMTDFAMD